MLIAHINNPAGIASIISKYQKEEGNKSEVYVFNNKIYKQFGGVKYNYSFPIDRWKFFRILKEYDVWHYHYPYGSLKNRLEKQNNNKIYIKHYHGDDLRGKINEDYCLVSTPDLLKYAPNGKWIPIPIDMEEIILKRRDKQKGLQQSKDTDLFVAHYPYYKQYPSNIRSFHDCYSNTLEKLQKEKRLKLVQILSIPHAEVLEIIQKCDIIIGKIIPDVGWIGKFELEGMALGKPVIAYVSNELFEKYRPPVFRTTRNTFKKDLESLIEDVSERERLSKEGPIYVAKYHSVDKIIKTIKCCYNDILNA